MSQAELHTGPAFPPRAGHSTASDRGDAWSGNVPVEAFIDAHRFSRFQWTLMGVCFLIVLIDGMDTAAIGYIAPALVKGWGITKGALAPVLSAALFGLAAGAVVSGPAADRFGRRAVLIAATAFFGAMSLATAFSGSIESLVALRFLTGIGLGAAIPNAVTLVSEYAPAKRRSIIVNTTYCGFTVGAALGGFISSWLIPAFGWHSLFVVGGVLPLVLACFVAMLVPESVRYLVKRGAPKHAIWAPLSKIAPLDLARIDSFHLSEHAQTQAKSSVGAILSRNYVIGTLMLWLVYFMGLVIFYLLMSWMPLLMNEAGFTPERAALLTALFPLGGGIGTIASGWLMDRWNANVVVMCGYLLTAVFIFVVGQAIGSIGLVSAVIFLAGTTMNGAQSSMPSLAAMFYPTQSRATGVSWMYGVGRFGGIAGVALGGLFAQWKLGLPAVFALLAVPSVIASVALFVKLKAHPDTRRA
ncbi:major facilitator superfamily transporter [Caballeronia novacaledonica]|uniref:Major facilitator superfamily transporter n=1 Tax=Caballeronia novacaledonica TaxID=1544861 RepID=A0A2U3I6B9_9BURK|nr:MFS transporter [Caballeronia novacaledonica]SPB15702.1 major facilitator superfamily transporter [Caballeronia novacaledonica]